MSASGLGPHERKLLRDFLQRPRAMNKLNLAAGVIACLAALVLTAPQEIVVVLAGLGGGLIGVSLEKRYLTEMRGVIEVLSRRETHPSS